MTINRERIRELTNKLLKQRNMSPLIGALINVYQTTALMYAPLTFIGVATTVYGLWGADVIRKLLPWFQFQHMLLLMVLVLPLFMLFFYKIIIPSIIAFGMQQQYKHRNPLVADVQATLQKQDTLDKKMDIVIERLSRLERQ